MLRHTPDMAAAQSGLLAAVQSGRIPRAGLVASVTRILTLKRRLAIGRAPGPMTQVGGTDRQAAAGRLSAAAVTVLRGACQGPLVRGPVRVTAPAGHDQQRA